MKSINIKLDPKTLKTPDKRFKAAAKFLMKDINYHFKKDGWDLDFRYYVTQVFTEVYKHNLEDYILAEILKAGYSLEAGENGLVIRKPKKKKRV